MWCGKHDYRDSSSEPIKQGREAWRRWLEGPGSGLMLGNGTDMSRALDIFMPSVCPRYPVSWSCSCKPEKGACDGALCVGE